jgi:endogenous inhibitor of DNA gyrase (YacG/DUF329 family)
VADTRACEQCGTTFVPRREHARFCSARCRVAWNRETLSIPAVEMSALQWSLAAMSDATERLAAVSVQDRSRAFAIVRDAVWWVTIVDATLVRYHPDAYDGVLAGQSPKERQLIEGTLGGLRFVRNRIGLDVDLADLLGPGAGPPGHGRGHIVAWTWKLVTAPESSSLSPRGRAWELARHRAYQKHLAGNSIRETFSRAAAFLTLTAANVPSVTKMSAHADR